MPPPSETQSVKVWDIAIRLFHWLLVMLFGFSWWTYETGRMNLHMLSGYCILTLVLFRILWGLFGSENARFSRFLHGPAAVITHLRHLPRRESDTELGHNAAGGWMVLVLLGLLLTQATSGLFANDDIITEGPLAHYVSGQVSAQLTRVHGINFNLLLLAIALHVLAVILYRVVKGQNLLLPMILGRKSIPAHVVQQTPQHASPIRALMLLVMAGAVVVTIARLG